MAPKPREVAAAELILIVEGRVSCPATDFWASQRSRPETALTKNLLRAELKCLGLSSPSLRMMIEDPRVTVRQMAVEGLLGLAEHEFSSWDGSGEIIAGMMNAGTFPTNWNGFVPDDRYLRDLIKYGQNHELLDEVSDNLSTMNRVLFKRLLTRRYVLNFFSPRSWGDDVKFNLDAPTF